MFPPSVRHELDGWTLLWADLQPSGEGAAELAHLRAEVVRRAHASHGASPLAEHPAVAAMRRLFRSVGCDPTRHRPSSEALLRRLLKGGTLPAIHPLVDLNNCLSVEVVAPCCVVAADALNPPLVLRVGEDGETMVSLRGPFGLAAKPLLADQAGPFGTPITDSERVKVTAETEGVWLVAYLPAAVVDVQRAQSALERLLELAPVANLRATATTQ